jgi:hypothetical protein
MGVADRSRPLRFSPLQNRARPDLGGHQKTDMAEFFDLDPSPDDLLGFADVFGSFS